MDLELIRATITPRPRKSDAASMYLTPAAVQPFDQKNLLQRQLTTNGASRSFGILDGSCMGGHWLITLCLSGKIN